MKKSERVKLLGATTSRSRSESPLRCTPSRYEPNVTSAGRGRGGGMMTLLSVDDMEDVMDAVV